MFYILLFPILWWFDFLSIVIRNDSDSDKFGLTALSAEDQCVATLLSKVNGTSPGYVLWILIPRSTILHALESRELERNSEETFKTPKKSLSYTYVCERISRHSPRSTIPTRSVRSPFFHIHTYPQPIYPSTLVDCIYILIRTYV